MSIRINDIAPDFTADSTAGTINFHDWLGRAISRRSARPNSAQWHSWPGNLPSAKPR